MLHAAFVLQEALNYFTSAGSVLKEVRAKCSTQKSCHPTCSGKVKFKQQRKTILSTTVKKKYEEPPALISPNKITT